MKEDPKYRDGRGNVQAVCCRVCGYMWNCYGADSFDNRGKCVAWCVGCVVQLTNSSRKGKRGERRAVNAWKAYGFDATRDDAILESTGRDTGRDLSVAFSEVGVDDLPIAVQVQEGDRLDFYGKIDQATDAASKDEIPVAQLKRNQQQAFGPTWKLVVMREAYFLSLLKALREYFENDNVMKSFLNEVALSANDS